MFEGQVPEIYPRLSTTSGSSHQPLPACSRLGLTSILQSYLLFDLSLDDNSLDDGIMAGSEYDDLYGYDVDRDDDDNDSIFSYLTALRY